ncbi:respiratory nitrate reductase subunit gamma [Bacillaceae bacterium S4-13-56]
MNLSMGQLIIWVVFPYSALMVFLMGLIWKYDRGTEDTKKALHPLCSVAVYSSLIIQSILTASLIVSEGFSWLKWYVSFGLFQPETELLVQASYMLQVQVVISFLILFILPFTRFIVFVRVPKREVQQLFHLLVQQSKRQKADHVKVLVKEVFFHS